MDFTILIDAMKQYGLAVTMLGVLSILFTGLFKIAFKSKFEKLEKETKKALYESTSIACSAVLALVYFLVSGGSGVELYCQEALATYAVAKVLYPLYENFRARDLLQFIVKKVTEKIDRKEDKDGND